MHHVVPKIVMNDELNFFIFSNALVKTLLIKLGDSALYVLFGSYFTE